MTIVAHRIHASGAKANYGLHDSFTIDGTIAGWPFARSAAPSLQSRRRLSLQRRRRFVATSAALRR